MSDLTPFQPSRYSAHRLGADDLGWAVLDLYAHEAIRHCSEGYARELAARLGVFGRGSHNAHQWESTREWASDPCNERQYRHPIGPCREFDPAYAASYGAAALAAIADDRISPAADRAAARAALVRLYSCIDCGADAGSECLPQYGCANVARRVPADVASMSALAAYAREWAALCEWQDLDIGATLDDMSDADVIRAAANHYDGGLDSLIADADAAADATVPIVCTYNSDGRCSRACVGYCGGSANTPRGIRYRVTLRGFEIRHEATSYVYASDIVAAATLAVSTCQTEERVIAIAEDAGTVAAAYDIGTAYDQHANPANQPIVIDCESDDSPIIGTFAGSDENVVSYFRRDGSVGTAPEDCVAVVRRADVATWRADHARRVTANAARDDHARTMSATRHGAYGATGGWQCERGSAGVDWTLLAVCLIGMAVSYVLLVCWGISL